MTEQEIVAFKSILSNYDYYQKKVEQLEMEIYYLYSVMSGSTSINYEGMHYAPDPNRYFNLMDRKDKLEKKRDVYISLIDYADTILERLPKEVMKATIECYVKRKRFEDVARKYHYSASGLHTKIKAELRRVELDQ